MKQLEEAERLLKKAAEDECLLDQTLTNEKVADATWGFHAQQAAEKILKAVLVSRQVTYPKTHDLAVLFELLSKHGIGCPVAIDDLDALTPFAVALRYDDEMDSDFDRKKARALVAELRSWSKSIVK